MTSSRRRWAVAGLAAVWLGWCAEPAAQPAQRLAVEGNHALGSAAIRERLALALPAPADSALLETAAGRLLALYAERGYLRARVTAAYHPARDGAQELRLTVWEGERTRLGRLRLAGCAGLPAERVEGALGLRPGRGVSACCASTRKKGIRSSRWIPRRCPSTPREAISRSRCACARVRACACATSPSAETGSRARAPSNAR